MSTGTVKFFNGQKGFGFIVNDDTKEEIFVHQSGLVDAINKNDKVTYEVNQGKRGPIATNVKLAKDA